MKTKTTDAEGVVTNTLSGVTDAVQWAEAWLAALAENPQIPTDKGTMIGWFANAIMAGYDAGRKAGENLSPSHNP